MKISTRAGRIEPFYVMEVAKAASELAREVAHSSRPMIFLNIGEPDFTAPPAVQEAAAKATSEIKQNEAKLVAFFKEKGLTVTEVDKNEFRDIVLKNVPFETFGYRKADWERIQAVK